MALTLYGIKNCDTVKKARGFLDAKGVAYAFHDYKTAGVAAEDLLRWCQAFGWQRVLNRAGTTFRKLAETEKTSLDETKALALMLRQPSLIKRPILEGVVGERPVLLLAFDAQAFHEALT
jgi:arsenate reductase